MTMSCKLEVLGQVSERARELEHESGTNELAEAMFSVYGAIGRPWPQLRLKLILLLALGVNEVMAGDRAASLPDPVGEWFRGRAAAYRADAEKLEAEIAACDKAQANAARQQRKVTALAMVDELTDCARDFGIDLDVDCGTPLDLDAPFEAAVG